MSIEEDLKMTKPLPITTKTVVNLMFTSNYILSKITTTLKPFDLSPQQYNVLRILRGQSSIGASLNSIQERMINRMSNTTRLIDKLERKKYVTRVIDETNRRKVSISITPLGLDLLLELDDLIEQTERNAIEHLDVEELEKLNMCLDKVRLKI